MKPERFKRTKSVVASSAIALVVAALVIGVSSFVLDPRSASSQHLGFQLTAGSVTVSNTIDATPAGAYPTTSCSGPGAKLHPGVADCLLYSVTNVLTVNVYVTSLSLSGITFSPSTTIASDPACNTADLTTTAFSSPSPNGRMIAPGATITVGEPISLKNDGNQDNCENGTFNFTDNVNAYYEDSTTTSLGTGTPNPSYPGNPVNFTASVTPSYPTLDASESNPPTLSTEPSPGDTVTFYECPSPSSCSSPLATLGMGTIHYNSGPGTYTATLSTSSLPTGTDYVEAAYLGSGTDFSASTSNIVTQTVQFSSACVSPPTSGANVTLTGTTNGNYTVPSGKSVWLNGGTITGNVTVPASGSFAATNGAVKGNISSSGGPISLQGTTVSNNITSSGGGVAIGPGSVLSGNLTDSGAGSVCAVGTSPSPVQISGSISVENQPTSSVPNSFCALSPSRPTSPMRPTAHRSS